LRWEKGRGRKGGEKEGTVGMKGREGGYRVAGTIGGGGRESEE